MGLTVHYHYEFRGRKTEVVRKLEGLRSRFMDLPLRSVKEGEPTPEHADV